MTLQELYDKGVEDAKREMLNESIETVIVKPRMIKNGTMKVEQYILTSFLFGLLISVIILSHNSILDEIKHSKQHQERFDALVRDSVKMHKIYENWEINYGELKKLEE